MRQRDTSSIGFLIFPGFPMACLTSMIEPLRVANEILGQTAFEWQLISENGERVVSSADVAFDPDTTLSDVPDFDYIFVLSAPNSKLKDAKSVAHHLRRLDRFGTSLGAVSGGVFQLVRSGLMDGHRCCVHWCYETAFRAEFPHFDFSDEVIITDRRRITISGAAAAFEYAIQMIEAKLGPDMATEVACWFQHPLVRGEGVRQRVPTFRTGSTGDMLPETVARGVELLSQNIDTPITIAEVARQLKISTKQLERIFKRSTGQSPKQYHRTLRMKAARQLVIYSKDNMASIAMAVGYSSASPMLAHYKATFGISPDEDRQRINYFRVKENISVPSA